MDNGRHDSEVSTYDRYRPLLRIDRRGRRDHVEVSANSRRGA